MARQRGLAPTPASAVLQVTSRGHFFVLRQYLDSVKRVGVQGHMLDDQTFERVRGMFNDDVVSAAEDGSGWGGSGRC